MAQRYSPAPAGAIITSGFGPRWNSTHYGIDIGRDGGSANMEVFAAQGGTVVYTGAASGFGGPDPAGWVVIDHPTADGAGTTVYGHIVRDDHIRPGVRVEAGQRIGRVNPDMNTNAGVAPHLHFEVHPTVWRPRSQIDPAAWLDGALSPTAGPSRPAASTGGDIVLFGVDVSEHQDGMSLKRAAAEGIAYAIVRTTDGTYKDRTYRSHVEDAESAGLAVATYHYLRNPGEGTSIAQQVDAAVQVMGDKRRPIWLDVETPAGLHVDHLHEAKRLFEQAGVRVIGLYSYVPYFEHKVAPSEPDSHAFGAMWVAAYGANEVGTPGWLYARANKRQWEYPLGNQKPVLWQFGSRATVAGFEVDINAFRGSLDDVRALFTGAPAVIDTDAKDAVDVADQITLPPTTRPATPPPADDYVGKHREPASTATPAPVPAEQVTTVETIGTGGAGPTRDTIVSRLVDAIIDAVLSVFMGKKGK